MNKRVFGLGLLFSLAIIFFCSNKASAYSISDSDSVMQKIIYTQALECYDSENPALGLSTSLDGFHGMISNLQGGDSGAMNRELLYYGDDPIWCNDLLTNKTANRFSSVEINDLSEKEKILEGMGYSKVSTTDDNSNTATKKCAAIGYHTRSKTEDKDKWTETICAERKNGRWLVTIDESGDSNAGKEVSISYNTQPGQLQFQYRRPQNLVEWWSCPWCAHYETKKITIDDNLSNVSSVFAHIANEIALEIGADGVSNHGDYDEFGEYWALCSKPVGTLDDSKVNCVDDSAHSIYLTSSGSSGDEYERVSASSFADKNFLVNKLSNGRWNYGLAVGTGIVFSNMEKYNLYSAYLKDVYGVSTARCYSSGGHDGVGNYYVKLWWPEEGKYSDYCYITVDDSNAEKKVTGLYDSMLFGRRGMKLTDIIDQLNALDLGDTPPTSTIIDNGSNDGSTDDGAISDGCYGAGLESQSWILCPTLNNMTSVVDGLDEIVGDMLSVDTTYFNQNNKTYEVWEIFRNIANTIMVVILLVIIFSQLTGYGIDNYGIKKMLPKLVLMAILINLSFFICELAIDLSNILGKGLDQMFRGMGNEIYDGSSNGQWIANIVGGVFGGAAAVGTAAPAISAVAGLVAGGAGPMVIISLILALLVALVAVLLFFLIIGARLMIIILFTAASPVAFACYILPNTQKIFKKWWDIFKAALIVYPICGALYGLSYLIRGLVSNGSGASFPLLLVATVAPFLPFLVLPSLLKGAISGLGAVSGAITSIGNGLRKGLSRGNQALQGTSAYKNQQEAQRRNMTRWRAGVTRDADGKYTSRDLSGIGRFLRGGKSGIADARAQLLRDENAQAKEDSYMGEGFDAAVIGQQKAVEADTTKDYMTLANSLTQNGEDKEALYNLYRKYEEEGNKSGMVAVARIAGRRKDTASDFMKEFAGNGKILNASVAKEVATGENSGMYRSSNPFMFEYAAQLNKGEFKGSFDQWKTPDNLNRAVKNYITSAKDLVGMKGDALETLKEAMADGRFDPETKARIRTLATDAIESRAYNNEFDSTKAKQVAELSGVYDYKIKNNRAVFEKQQNATEFDVPHGDGPVDDAGQII